MAIYYYPNPATKPNPTGDLTGAGKFFGPQDVYLLAAGTVSVGLLGSGLAKGSITLPSANYTTSWVGVSGGYFPGSSNSPGPSVTGSAPSMSVSILSADNIAQGGQPALFVPLSVYGGSAKNLKPPFPSPYSVTCDTLPDGLTLYTSRTNINVTGTAPTASGAATPPGTSATNSTITFSFTANKLVGFAPQVGTFYAVRGQTKLSFNGIWECTAVTTNSISLKYNTGPTEANPGPLTNTIPGQTAWDTTATTSITDAGIKIIPNSSGVKYWYNYADILIAGTPTLASANKPYNISFVDAAGSSISSSFNLQVSGGAQPLDTVLDPYTSLLSQNVAVSFTPVRATGGATTKTFTAPGGLPAGLSISASGVISGIPNPASGSQPYTILVTDSSGATSSKQIILEVRAPAVNVALAQNQAYSYVATVPFTEFKPILGTGGIAPLTYTVLPTVSDYGLTFTSTGTVRGPGTTVTGGPKSFEVTVTDSNKPTSSTNKLSFS